ncbi:MAG: hypothetical protein RL693_134 [Verrucomicrobiota bacterium]|jgi:N-acetylmuramoyl-L-alanine amidase
MTRMLISYGALFGAALCLLQIPSLWEREQRALCLPPEFWDDKIKDTLVVLDAGHGGVDGGTQGHGILEKQATLELTHRVGKELSEAGVRVVMTRGVDVYVDLEERSATANRNQASLFVSIHMNADATSVETNGVETYFCERKKLGDIVRLRNSLSIPEGRVFKDKRSELLATTVHRHVCQATGAIDRKVRDSNYLVVMQTECPSILVECGYLTNEAEAAKLKDGDYKARLATALAEGIKTYLGCSKMNPRRGIVIENAKETPAALPATVANP